MSTTEYYKSAIDICTNHFIKRMYYLKQVINYIKINFKPTLKHQIIEVDCPIEHHCDLELLEYSLNEDCEFANQYIGITNECDINFETGGYKTSIRISFVEKNMYLA